MKGILWLPQTNFLLSIAEVSLFVSSTSNRLKGATTKLSSFLSYELNIASEAILDGEEGAKMASTMIEELIIKIKEEKEWLSTSG